MDWDLVARYAAENPEQVPLLIAELLFAVGGLMWFANTLIGFFRDSNKSQSAITLKILEEMSRATTALNANSAAMVINSQETTKYIATLNETLKAMQNDLVVIKDTTDAHRRGFESLQLQNRLTQLEQAQKSHVALLKRSQRDIYNHQEKILKAVHTLQSQLKSPSL